MTGESNPLQRESEDWLNGPRTWRWKVRPEGCAVNSAKVAICVQLLG